MPIPARLRPPTPTVEEFREYMGLAREIVNAIEDRANVSALLAQWNGRAGWKYTSDDFRFHGAVGTEMFVAGMLLGVPALVPDLTYAELREVFRSMQHRELSQAVESHYLNWLEMNLPNANVTGLIYWPNEWFGDEAPLHAELSADQLLAYAMAKCGRPFPDAPADVPMPYPIPAKS